jgi:ABC-2 type transport system permease protein
MGALAAGFGLQLRTMRREAGDVMDIFVGPLYALIFLSIVQHAERPDLLGHAVLAPVLIALWSKALFVAGELIDRDRWAGTLEPAVATPASLQMVVLGRIAATTVFGFVALAQTWLIAWLLFGEVVRVHHPFVFLAAFAATILATAATAVIMAAVFVLARSARTFQNALSYPFYVLGGVLAPVALLPDWVQPLSRLVYLSWAADLLRDALSPQPVTAFWARLAVVLGLAAVSFAVGRFLLGRVLRRVRDLGTVTYA